MERTVCELFAGVGGFRLGLERSTREWRTVWFSQWEPNRAKQWAHACYVSHWSDIDITTGIDISLVDKSTIPDHNLIVGGFPCQDYSVARPLPGSTGLQGEKGVLWWQIRDALEAKAPPFGLFENVDRMLRSPAQQKGRDFGVMLASLAALGYFVEWRVINAAEYGAAQRRRRVFIFISKAKTRHVRRLHNKKDAILTSAGFFAKTFPVEGCGPISSVALPAMSLTKIFNEFSFKFENAGYMDEAGIVHTAKVVPKLEDPVCLSSLLQQDVPEKYYLGEDTKKWEYLKGSKRVVRTSKTGHEYIFAEGAIAFPDPLHLPARTILTSESSLNRSTHIIRDPQTERLRTLTPIEVERIQGFDEDWTKTGMPEKFRYFCMGNALVVHVITRMGKTLDHVFAQEG